MIRQLFIATVLIPLIHGATKTYDSSYASCLDFIKNFDNVCDSSAGPIADFQNWAGQTVSCPASVVGTSTISGSVMCAGSVDPTTNICSWKRKLCVTCSTNSTGNFIRVQSNSLPNRCYYGGKWVPSDQTFIDFEVRWNVALSSSTINKNSIATCQDDVNNIICSFTHLADNTIQNPSYLKEYGTNLTKEAIGIALDGVLLNPGVNDYKVDIFYPPESWAPTGYVNTGGNTVQDGYDQCGAHTNSNGYYHYHAPSSCILNPQPYQSGSIQPCVDVTDCWGQAPSYQVNQFNHTQTPIAIAKDGRIVWSPYNSQGETYDPCDVDICNGVWLDGYYSYVSTSFHPYNPGCFGPGSTVPYAQQCSANTQVCTSTWNLNQSSSRKRAQISKNKNLSQKSANGL